MKPATAGVRRWSRSRNWPPATSSINGGRQRAARPRQPDNSSRILSPQVQGRLPSPERKTGQPPRATRRSLSERELQAELHHAAAARTDQRIAGPDVRCLTAAAERSESRGVGAAAKARRRAVRIGDGGVVKHVKEFGAELRAEAFLKPELLEDGEIHILEASVAEDVPAHGAERSGLGRSHHRFALYEA